MRRPRGLMDSVISSRFDHKLLDHFSPYFAAVQSFKFYAYLRVNSSINVPLTTRFTNIFSTTNFQWEGLASNISKKCHMHIVYVFHLYCYVLFQPIIDIFETYGYNPSNSTAHMFASWNILETYFPVHLYWSCHNVKGILYVMEEC